MTTQRRASRPLSAEEQKWWYLRRTAGKVAKGDAARARQLATLVAVAFKAIHRRDDQTALSILRPLAPFYFRAFTAIARGRDSAFYLGLSVGGAPSRFGRNVRINEALMDGRAIGVRGDRLKERIAEAFSVSVETVERASKDLKARALGKAIHAAREGAKTPR